MSRLTHEDRLVDLLLPAVRSTWTERSLRRNRAVDLAISADGYIEARALLPASTVREEFDCSSATASSSNTVDPVAYMTTVIVLGAGVWRLRAMGGLTGRLSSASTLNTFIRLDGNLSDNYQVPLAANDTGVAWPMHGIDAAQGEIQLDLMFRPSAGTATIEAGYWRYRAERIG